MNEEIKKSINKLNVVVELVNDLELAFVETMDDEESDRQSILLLIREMVQEAIQCIDKPEKLDRTLSGFENGVSFK